MNKTLLNRGIMLWLYSSTRAAIDLASIMVGIIVIGIIGGVIAATVFAVIPWSQDNAAKANIGAVRTAESAYRGFTAEKGAPGDYGTNAQLASYATDSNSSTSFLDGSNSDRLTVETSKDSDGNPCYSVASKSDSGKIFYATSKSGEISTDPSITGACVQLSTDPTGPAGGANGTIPTPDSDSHVILDTNVNAAVSASEFDISGYNVSSTGTDVKNFIVGAFPSDIDSNNGFGYWYPEKNANLTLSYYDPATEKLVPFLVTPDIIGNASATDATVVYDPTSNTFWGWFGTKNTSLISNYAADFTKMKQNGGSISFVSEVTDVPNAPTKTGTVAAVWTPATGSTPDQGTPTQLPETGAGSSNPAHACGNYGSHNYSAADMSWGWSATDEWNGNSCDLQAGFGTTTPANFTPDSALGTPTVSGYSTHEYRPDAYNQTTYYSGSANKDWVAQEGTPLTVKYYDDNGNLQSFGNYTVNDNYSYSAPDASHSQENYTSYSGTFDSNSQFAAFSFGKSLSVDNFNENPNLNYPDSCLTDFMNENYKTSFPGNTTYGSSTVCPDPSESVSLRVYGVSDKTLSTKLASIAKNGGQVIFTTTAGKTITVPVAPGSWQYSAPQAQAY